MGGLLLCKCGNIKLYTVNKDAKLTEFTLPSGCQDLPVQDAFFSNVSIQRFGVGGVVVALPLLGANRRVGNWQILYCKNCNVDAYAAQDVSIAKANRVLGEGLVLVSRDVVVRDSDLNGIYGSVNYSHVFNFILRPDLYPEALPSDITNHQEFLLFLSELQSMVNQKVKEEEKNTDERIRVYQHAQEEQLRKYIEKANRDKALVFNTVRSLTYDEQQRADIYNLNSDGSKSKMSKNHKQLRSRKGRTLSTDSNTSILDMSSLSNTISDINSSQKSLNSLLVAKSLEIQSNGSSSHKISSKGLGYDGLRPGLGSRATGMDMCDRRQSSDNLDRRAMVVNSVSNNNSSTSDASSSDEARSKYSIDKSNSIGFQKAINKEKLVYHNTAESAPSDKMIDVACNGVGTREGISIEESLSVAGRVRVGSGHLSCNNSNTGNNKKILDQAVIPGSLCTNYMNAELIKSSINYKGAPVLSGSSLITSSTKTASDSSDVHFIINESLGVRDVGVEDESDDNSMNGIVHGVTIEVTGADAQAEILIKETSNNRLEINPINNLSSSFPVLIPRFDKVMNDNSRRRRGHRNSYDYNDEKPDLSKSNDMENIALSIKNDIAASFDNILDPFPHRRIFSIL